VRITMIATLKQAYETLNKKGTLNIKQLLEMANQITDSILNKPDFLVQLKDIRNSENALYAHSIQVCMLSVLLAKNLEYNALQIKQVAVGALLHDIGYAVAGLKDPYHEHPKKGFDFLRSFHEINLLSAHMVLQHHEKLNGEGFPLGVKDKELREFAQICAISNDFDHFVNDTESEHLPHEGIEYVMAMAGSSYEVDLVKAFVQNIAPYPVGTLVKLTNNMKGKVFKVEKERPTRPVLSLYNNAKLNLYDYPTLFVKEILHKEAF
jgi:putative nucleotidyltransferase with HDIG domain